MKNSIIKNFSGWKTMNENLMPATSGTSGASGTSMPPGTSGASGTSMPPKINEEATPINITNPDGRLTLTDLQAVQRALIDAGFLAKTFKDNSGKDIGSDDGKLGPVTIKAIEEFRQANGIKDDSYPGVSPKTGAYIGSKTLEKLKNPTSSQPSSAGPTSTAGTAGASGQASTSGSSGTAGASGQATTSGASAQKGSAGTSGKVASPIEEIVAKITKPFQEGSTEFAGFKGRGGIFGNDNEKGAIERFTMIWNDQIKPLIDKLPADDPNKQNFSSLLPVITSGIERKLNKVPITYTGADGKPVTVNINADF